MTRLAIAEPPSRRPWTFCNGGGAVYSREFELRDDGTVEGYDHPNERRWRTENGAILLMRADGVISCVLRPQEPCQPGEEVYRGTFRFAGPGSTEIHVLKRALPKTACFLRTHFWDSAVELAYRALGESWRGEVIVMGDHTQPFEVPAHLPQIRHSAAKFRNYQLPLRPSVEETLWWNGDYALYDLFLNTDFDYFLVAEYDLYLDTDLRAAMLELIRSGVEFAALNLQPAEHDWAWLASQTAWDAFEAVRDPASDPEAHMCFFPLVFASRRLAGWLYARRVQAGFALLRSGAPEWPFCESFAATEAARSGLDIADIRRFLPEPHEDSVYDAVSWSEISQYRGKLIHPVLSGDRFVNKVLFYASTLHPEDDAARSQWLRDRLSRLPEGADKQLLRAKVSCP
jgi:hypothetical protein